MNRIFVFALGLFFSEYAFSQECEVSPQFLMKECAQSYHRVRSQNELEDYLENGKFEGRQLKNLLIDFDVKEKEVSIASACDIKIVKHRKVKAALNGICINGRNIFLEEGNSLKADRKAPIRIISRSNILSNNSKIDTDGILELKSDLFSPFDSRIHLVSADVKASSVLVDSKSGLVIERLSKIKADKVMLNGGECNISPLFVRYQGNCLKPFKLKGKIETKGSLKVDSEVSLFLENQTNVYWKVNNTVTQSEKFKYIFAMPGRYYVRAVVKGKDEKYATLEKYLDISGDTIFRGQGLFFSFHKELPVKLLASVDNNLVFLKKIHKQGIYALDAKLDTGKDKTIIVPFLGYQTKIKIKDLPKISNPTTYINAHFEKLEQSFNNFEDVRVSSMLVKSIQKIKKDILKLNSKERELIAIKLQANSQTEEVVTSRIFPEFFKTIFADAHAEEVISHLDDELTDASNEYLRRDLQRYKVVKKAMVFFSSGVLLLTVTTPAFVDKILAAAFFFQAFDELHSFAKEQDVAIKRVYNVIKNFAISDAAGAEVHNIYIRGNARKVDILNDSFDGSIGTIINAYSELNSVIVNFNEELAPLRNFLSDYDVNIPEIGQLSFPEGESAGSLNPNNIVDVKLISSERGNVSLQKVTKYSNKLELIFESLEDQKVVVRFTYRNDVFGVNVYKDFYLNVVSSLPKPELVATVDKFNVKFQAKFPGSVPNNLIYSWDFGDGGSSGLVERADHKYVLPGLYNVKLTLHLAGNEEKSLTVEKQIEIAPVAEIHYSKNKFKVQFDATSPRNQHLDGLIYLWDFGDGKVLETSSPTIEHNYIEAKEYDVTLQVYSNTGSSNFVTEKVDIQAIEVSYFLKLNTRGTYLYTDNKDLDFGNTNNLPWGLPFPSQFVDLGAMFSNSDINLRPGDMVYLKVSGDYRYGRNGAEVNNMLLGVFTDGTNFYFPGPDSDFIPVVTPNTIKTNTRTDIPQDFEIFADEDTIMQIPAGATRIAFAVLSSNPGMTNDSDGDFGVWVKIKIIRDSNSASRVNQNLD